MSTIVVPVAPASRTIVSSLSPATCAYSAGKRASSASASSTTNSSGGSCSAATSASHAPSLSRGTEITRLPCSPATPATQRASDDLPEPAPPIDEDPAIGSGPELASI